MLSLIFVVLGCTPSPSTSPEVMVLGRERGITTADAEAMRAALEDCLAHPERLGKIPADHRPALLGSKIGEPFVMDDGVLRLPPWLLEGEAERLRLTHRPLPQTTASGEPARAQYRYVVKVERVDGAWRVGDPTFELIHPRR